MTHEIIWLKHNSKENKQRRIITVNIYNNYERGQNKSNKNMSGKAQVDETIIS